MRSHIHFGHGRFVHRHHIQHALHHGRPMHTGTHLIGRGTAPHRKNIGSFTPAMSMGQVGNGMKTGHHTKSLKPLKFKF